MNMNADEPAVVRTQKLWRPHCAQAAIRRRREPRASGVFHPIFGSLVQPGHVVNDVADRAVAAAIGALAHAPKRFAQAVAELKMRKGQRHTGLCAPFHIATTRAISEAASGVAQRMRDGDWFTALSLAIVSRAPFTVRALCRAAAAGGMTKRDLNVAMRFEGVASITALGLAASAGVPATTALLLEAGANPNANSKDANSNVVVAINSADDAETVRLLIQHGARTGGALNVAARQRAFRSMEVLLAAGVYVDELGGEEGITALAAVLCTEAQDPAPEATLRCVELLLDAGATIDNCGALAPLAAAASFELRHAVELMVEKRGPEIPRCRVADKAMVAAIRTMDTGVVKLLLGAGIPIGDVRFALFTAAQKPSGTLAEAVLVYVAENDARRERYAAAVQSVAGKTLALAIDEHGWSAATVRRVFAPHRDWFPLDGHGADGFTALQRAVDRAQIPMVRTLLDCGANPAAKARDRRTTALSIAQRKLDAAAEGSVERRLAQAVCEQLERAAECGVRPREDEAAP